MIIVAISFYIAFAFFYYQDILKRQNKFILKMPYYILILEIWASFSQPFGINTGINGMISFFLISYIIYYLIHFGNRIKNIGFILIAEITIFLTYIFARTDFTISFESMTTRYLSYVILFLLIPITYAEVRRIIDFKYYVVVVRKLLLLYLIATILFSLFKVGDNMYNTNIIFGLAHMQPNSIAFLVSIMLFFAINLNATYKNRIYKRKLSFLCLFIIFIICLTFRRTYLFIIITTFSVLEMPNMTRAKHILLLLVSALLILGMYSVVGIKRDRFTIMDTEKEGRFIEYNLVKEMMEKDMSKKIFGDGELFVTRGKYGLEGRDNRPLHTGHTELLLGSGVLGLSMFILIMITLFIKMIKDSWSNNMRSKLYPLIWTFPLIYIILSFSGGVRSPSSMIIMITFVVFSRYIANYKYYGQISINYSSLQRRADLRSSD